MNTNIIGDQDWECDGCKVTPAMRREILAVVTDFYDDWQTEGVSYQWDRTERRLVCGDPNQVETLGDLLGEITGPQNWYFPFNFQYINDDFEEWLKGYLHEMWGEAVHQVQENEDADPIHEAVIRTFDWLEDLRVDDVLAWQKAEFPAKENESFEKLELLMAEPWLSPHARLASAED